MDKALGYLALAKKAGKLVIGAEDCGEILRRGKGALAVLASDAGGNTVRQAHELTDRGHIPLLTAYTKMELSGAVGRNSGTALVVFTDRGLAQAFAGAIQTESKQEEHI